MVSLTVYDGANGIGGNKLYLEDKGHEVSAHFCKNFWISAAVLPRLG